MFVVAFADEGEVGVWHLPLPGGEGEGVEALRGGIAEVLFQRTAVFARPDFMDGRLDDGVVIPAVGGEDRNCISEDTICWCS